jgi:pimeloyl-ACP methyl ester carboxylesterase
VGQGIGSVVDLLSAGRHAAQQFVDQVALGPGQWDSPPFFALILDRIAPLLSRSRRQTIEGAGHTPQASHPKEYAEALVSFMSG